MALMGRPVPILQEKYSLVALSMAGSTWPQCPVGPMSPLISWLDKKYSYHSLMLQDWREGK